MKVRGKERFQGDITFCNKYVTLLDGEGNMREYKKTRVCFEVDTEFYVNSMPLTPH